MVAPPRSSPRRTIASQALPVPDSSAPASEPHITIDTPTLMRDIARLVAGEAERWHMDLSVTIGRASALTGLPQPQIRYLEELGVFQTTKASDQEGAPRLYTLRDLRRLSAAAELLKKDYRPAEVARLVREHAVLIEQGHHHSLAQLFAQESSVISDGFVLARLMSQLMMVVQAELTECTGIDLQVEGLLFPLRPLPASVSRRASAAAIQKYGQSLLTNLANVLVGIRFVHTLLDSAGHVDDFLDVQACDPGPGRNDRTVVFFSPAPQQPYVRNPVLFCLYVPPDAPEQHLLVLVTPVQSDQLPVLLETLESSRHYLFERLRTMILQLSTPFRRTSFLKNYRYRSDGFEISLTRENLNQFAHTIKTILFPDDPQSLVVILFPNSLDAPASLSILAHAGYAPEDAKRFRLQLHGPGEGLSGRAYNLREPFLSLDCAHDPRVAYALNEESCAALAIPLSTTWGIAPFGVLYIAARQPGSTLSHDQAFMAMLLSSLLSELLGRWWLTRLRREQDTLLFTHMKLLQHWFDGVDAFSPDLKKALAALYLLWQAVHTIVEQPDGSPTTLDLQDTLTLIVLDIDNYRQRVQLHSNDLFPVRAQHHVESVVWRVLPANRPYWFKNDHALIILEHTRDHDIARIIERIKRQVKALPVRIPGNEDFKIAVSAAWETMTYQELHDLDPHALRETTDFYTRIGAIIETLRQQAGATAKTNIPAPKPKP